MLAGSDEGRSMLFYSFLIFILYYLFVSFSCLVPAEFKTVFDLRNAGASGDGPQFRMNLFGMFQLQKVISAQPKCNFGFALVEIKPKALNMLNRSTLPVNPQPRNCILKFHLFLG